MTTIQINAQTTVSVNDLVSALLDGNNLTVGVIKALQARLDNIVLPWQKDGYTPPRFVRLTAAGKQVGVVDSHLNSYGDAHNPYKHGWGFKGSNPRGQGRCIQGIMKVDLTTEHGHLSSDEPTHREGIKLREAEALLKAQAAVDEFLRENFRELTLLGN